LIRSENIKLFLWGTAVVLIQIVLLRHLSIAGAEPDLVFLYLLWLCKDKNRTTVLLFAAYTAFLQDALSDLWGIHLFSKTFTLFILHNYLNRISQTRFYFWQVAAIVFVSTLIFNLIFSGVAIFSDLYASGSFLWIRIAVASVYTALLGSFLYLVKVTD